MSGQTRLSVSLLFGALLLAACANLVTKMGRPSDGPLLEGRIHLMNEGFSTDPDPDPVQVAIYSGERVAEKPRAVVALNRYGEFAIHLPPGAYCLKVKTVNFCSDTDPNECDQTLQHPEDGTARFAYYRKYCD